MVSPRIVIVTGLSGAGKTQALRILEDLGYFCVDNLPPTLVPKFADLCAQTTKRINNIALGLDIRGGDFFQALTDTLDELERGEFNFTILFLEASEDILVRRYKESRRRHPLGTHGEVLRYIREERNLLREIRDRSSVIVDTSALAPRQLKEKMAELYGSQSGGDRLLITVMSFGFKYGLPLDSDLVMDVRFLPNPFYDEELRPLTGNDPAVRDFVLNSRPAIRFMHKFSDLLYFLLPCYRQEGKATLMIAIGCTGGKHRSVALANHLAELLKGKSYQVIVSHRDIGRSN